MLFKNSSDLCFAWLLMIICLPSFASAQRTAKVEGEYRYILGANDDVTIKQARNKCIEMAQAEAIRKEFGSTVSSDMISSEKEINDNSSSSYLMETTNTTRAEWLADEKPPMVSMAVEGDDIVFTAHVWGKAREITKASTDIKWETAKMEGGRLVESTGFNSGERIYLRFRTPVAGYLAVCILDETDKVYNVLPYKKDATGRFKVDRKEEYILFDKTQPNAHPHATPLKLSTDNLQEHDQMVVIFSPNPFSIDSNLFVNPSSSDKIPNIMKRSDFDKWLLKKQKEDKDMMVQKKWLTIHGQEKFN